MTVELAGQTAMLAGKRGLIVRQKGEQASGCLNLNRKGREEGEGVTGHGWLGASPARPLDGRDLHCKAGGTRGWAWVAIDGYQLLGGMVK